MTDVNSSFSGRALLRLVVPGLFVPGLVVPGLVVPANVRLDAIDPLTSP